MCGDTAFSGLVQSSEAGAVGPPVGINACERVVDHPATVLHLQCCGRIEQVLASDARVCAQHQALSVPHSVQCTVLFVLKHFLDGGMLLLVLMFGLFVGLLGLGGTCSPTSIPNVEALVQCVSCIEFRVRRPDIRIYFVLHSSNKHTKRSAV